MSTLGPIWVQWIFSVSCLLVGGYYATVLLTRKRETRDGSGPRDGSGKRLGIGYELSHLGMALGMAAMFSPVGDPFPEVLWLILFGMLAAWFASWALREGLRADDTAQHLVANLAMLFMVLAMRGHPAGLAGAQHSTDQAGADQAGVSHAGHVSAAAEDGGWIAGPIGMVLIVLLAGYFVVHAARSCHQLVTAAAPSAPQGSPAASATRAIGVRSMVRPRVEAASHVVMSVAMAVMFGLLL